MDLINKEDRRKSVGKQGIGPGLVYDVSDILYTCTDSGKGEEFPFEGLRDNS